MEIEYVWVLREYPKDASRNYNYVLGVYKNPKTIQDLYTIPDSRFNLQRGLGIGRWYKFRFLNSDMMLTRYKVND